MDMMDNLPRYYTGNDKEIVSRFVEYCKNLFINSWLFYCVEDEHGLDDFYRRTYKCIDSSWRVELADVIINQFKQKLGVKHDLLLPTTLRKLIQPQVVGEANATLLSTLLPDVSTEVEGVSLLSDEVLDTSLPSLLEVEQNPGIKPNFWQFFEYVRGVLEQRASILREANIVRFAQVHESAIQMFSKIFGEVMKNAVFQIHQMQFINERQQLLNQQRRSLIHRQTGLVSNLTVDQLSLYDTPSL